LLNCNEFVNADNIAAGLSPFNPESVALEAGRIMLQRIDELLNKDVDFAFETTLSTRSYVSLVKKAQQRGYEVTLLFFWLSSPNIAMQRVATRVREGGHNIPVDVIERRYYRGIKNLISLYIALVKTWFVIKNMDTGPEVVARGEENSKPSIVKPDVLGNNLSQVNKN
jgi:predicted ABC-type ATPase